MKLQIRKNPGAAKPWEVSWMGLRWAQVLAFDTWSEAAESAVRFAWSRRWMEASDTMIRLN